MDLPHHLRSNVAISVVDTANSTQSTDNNVMHAKPDLRVFLKWKITGSGSVITAVIQRKLWIDVSHAVVMQSSCSRHAIEINRQRFKAFEAVSRG